MQDGWNWFAYTANNPLKYIDPTGNEAYAIDVTANGHFFTESSGGFGIAFDNDGNIMIYGIANYSAGNQVGGDFSINGSYTEGNINEFKEHAVAGQVGIDVGPGISGGVSKGTSPDSKTVYSGSVNLGPSFPVNGVPVPVSVSAGGGYVKPIKEINIFEKVTDMAVDFWNKNNLPSLNPSDWLKKNFWVK